MPRLILPSVRVNMRAGQLPPAEDNGGIRLHLSELKGPVMDRLERGHFSDKLTGSIYLSHFEAMRALAPGITASALHPA